MRLDGGTVDESPRWRPHACAGAKEADPDAFLRPSYEAVVERLIGPVLEWCIDPASARFGHMNQAALRDRTALPIVADSGMLASQARPMG